MPGRQRDAHRLLEHRRPVQPGGRVGRQVNQAQIELAQLQQPGLLGALALLHPHLHRRVALPGFPQDRGQQAVQRGADETGRCLGAYPGGSGHQRAADVPITGIGKKHDDDRARCAGMCGEAEGGVCGGSGGDAREDPFLAGEPARCLERLVIVTTAISSMMTWLSTLGMNPTPIPGIWCFPAGRPDRTAAPSRSARRCLI
jgi:hypothetical protein